MFGRTGRSFFIIAVCLLLSRVAFAHYFYTQFATSSGPYLPIVQKFDVSSLPNGTIRYFISSSGPTKFASGDSFRALVSEIRAAADVWNGVTSSSLKLEYGGLFQPGNAPSSPGIFIQFSKDIPAGLLAISQPAGLAPLQTASDGTQFYPIVHSSMLLPLDVRSLPSYGEEMFATLVHEFGHTMGLQHTITSSVMSTYVTTGASRANPLAADDIAGFSWLYPTGDFLSQTGSVAGRVTDSSGNGVNLASVAAIAPGVDAVSAFTNPDGTFLIPGIPPGTYHLYVQPLPPPFEGQTTNDGIVYPVGHDGKTTIPPSQFFAGQFFPGTTSWSAASPIQVVAGVIQSAFNFRVRYEQAPSIYGVRTYGYVPNGVAVASPPIVEGTTLTVEAAGVGLVANNALVPGLNLDALGTLAEIVPGSISVYPPPNPYGYIFADLDINAKSSSGPGHLLFETPGDVYVLPSAFHVVMAPPPEIDAIASFTSRIVAIQGKNLNANTRVFFDGAQGTIKAITDSGLLIVSAPAAPGGYQANVVALNPDGQSSLFLVGSPVKYRYSNSNSPAILVSPATLPSGATVTVDVKGVNTDFMQGQTIVGFGTSDAVVSNVVVESASHLIVTVTTAPHAQIQTAQAINIADGLELLSPALGLAVGLE